MTGGDVPDLVSEHTCELGFRVEVHQQAAIHIDVAAAGSDPAVSVDAMHRIDPAVVKREFEAAGLRFEAESPMLQNPADDHTKPVFDESVSHKTDQFVYKFRKP